MLKIFPIKLLGVLVLITASFFLSVPGIALAQSPEVTTVFIVRHAEKSQDPCTRSDPSCEFQCDVCLSPEGKARAEQLVHVLSQAKINAIYSTNTHRTKETAEPLLDFLKPHIPQLDIESYRSAREVAEKVKREHSGQRLLIVSHSDMVEDIIEQLNGNRNACPISNDYDNLCLVIIDSSDETEVIELHYGEPSSSFANLEI